MQPVEMQVPKKQRTFSSFFAQFLKFRFIIKFVERKDDPHSLCISKITHYERRV